MDRTSYPLGQKDKLDHLLTVIEKLFDRYASIEKSLESKCEMNEIMQLDTRIKQLEEILGSFGTEMENRLSSVEGHMKTNSTTVGTEREKTPYQMKN